MTPGEASNTAGAVIFTLYVVAALVLTTLIVSNLIKKYDRLSVLDRHALKPQLYVFSVLSFTSFATLSFHMLNYLIVSFRKWALNIGLSFDSISLVGRLQDIGVHIWPWLTSSTLFLDFASTICATSPRYWWTQQALLMTLAWSAFMAVQGQKNGIPNLWTFALISQILPVSFATNLFFINLLLYGTPVSDVRLRQSHSTLPEIIFVVLYSSLLLAAPFSVDTRYFLTTVGLIRLLIFCPLVYTTIMSKSRALDFHRVPSAVKVFALCSVFLLSKQSFDALTSSDGNIKLVLGAINDDPSVSALGYDYLLELISTAVWMLDAKRSPRLTPKSAYINVKRS